MEGMREDRSRSEDYSTLHYVCTNNYRHRQHDQRKQHKLRNDGSHGNNKCNNKKSLPERKDKGFQPWCLHGKHANHSHNKCRANPHNQARKQ